MLLSVFAALAVALPAASSEPRLSSAVHPQKYVLQLDVDPAQERFHGEVTIPLMLDRPTDELRLRGLNLTVEQASVATGKAKPVPMQTTARGESLLFRAKKPLPAGPATLFVRWSGSLDGSQLRGLYRYKQGETWWVGSQFEATDARRMAPCFDEPGFKVPLELTVNVPPSITVIANTRPLKETADPKSGRRRIVFEPTPPLPTYLWALVMGPYDAVDAGRAGATPVRVFVPAGKAPQASYAARVALASVHYLEDYFAFPYAYGKLDLVSLGEFGSGAMENAGAVTFREEALLLDETAASVGSRRGIASTIAHELAHQWFGDVVTMAWWDDLWLNEAFATWMSVKVLEAFDPALRARLNRLAGKRGAMAFDALPSSHPIKVPMETEDKARDIFDVITYSKGGAVLSMLEAWLGEDTFRDGLRLYMKRHAHGNATSEDLFRALAEASGKPVPEVARSWIHEAGHPVISISRECTATTNRLKLSQSRYHAVGGAGGTTPWLVPVCARFPVEGGTRTACSLLQGKEGSLELGTGACPAWVLPDAGAHGFYSWSLPAAEYRALADTALRELTVAERVDLIGNGWALVKFGALGVDAHLEALRALRTDTEGLVLGALADRYGTVLHMLVDPADKPLVRRAAAAQFGDAAARAGWDERPGEDPAARELRTRMLGAMLLVAEDPGYTAEADRRARAWLADARAVPSDVAGIALASAARRFTSAELATVKAALKTADTPERRVRLISALSASLDPAVMREGLSLVSTDDIRVQDTFGLIASPMGDERSAPTGWAWYKENYAAVKAKVPEQAMAWMPMIGSGFCTKAERDDLADFFGKNQVPGTATRLAEALDMVDVCIAMREAQRPAMQRFVAGLKQKEAEKSPPPAAPRRRK